MQSLKYSNESGVSDEESDEVASESESEAGDSQDDISLMKANNSFRQAK